MSTYEYGQLRAAQEDLGRRLLKAERERDEAIAREIDTGVMLANALGERDEARAVVKKYHDWLERVGLPSTGYFGLDHAVGQNVGGCVGCNLLFDEPRVED